MRDFRKYPWEYAHKKLQPSDSREPTFDCDTASSYFSSTYSDNTVTYECLPSWASERIPDCDFSLLNVESITPSLVKATLQRCSMKSAPGINGITYYHLIHLSSSHHFMATLFNNKILEKGTAPSSWGIARIKPIYKNGSTSDPSNFRPIALTSVVGKLLHKILSNRLERYLRVNTVLDTSIQKGFVSGLPGVFEHIYTLSTILQDSTTYKKPLMMTFLDLKNAFGSVSQSLIFDMLNVVKVPNFFSCYVESFYSLLSVAISGKLNPYNFKEAFPRRYPVPYYIFAGL